MMHLLDEPRIHVPKPSLVPGALSSLLSSLASGSLGSMTRGTGGCWGRAISLLSQDASVGVATVDAAVTASAAATTATAAPAFVILIDKGGHLALRIFQHGTVVVLQRVAGVQRAGSINVVVGRGQLAPII